METFDLKLGRYVRRIEEALPGYMPPASGLEKNVREAMAYSLLGGGKRIRGVMLLAFYRIFQDELDGALPFACALEMVHAYSLIHDDLPCMDDDDLRRGKPSCHVAFGEAIALLAGDGLLTLAFETAAGESGIAPGLTLRSIRELATAAGTMGMIGGQVIDLEHENKTVDISLLREMCAKKTGALFRAACRIGCILGGAGENDLALADIYAQKVGLAFQIVDDLLDRESSPGVLGKPIGSDNDNHKSTFATLYTHADCRDLVSTLAAEAKDALRSGGLPVEFLCELADMLSVRQF